MPRVLSITIAPRNDIPAGTTFNADLRRGTSLLRTEWVDPANPDVSIPRLLALADSVDLTIVTSYLATGTLTSTTNAPNVVLELIHQLAARAPKMVLVALGNPYLLRQVPEVGTYLIGWGGFPVSQRAAALALLGEIPITGKMPISIPPLVQFGAGETRAKR
jgi:hypothetical protein